MADYNFDNEEVDDIVASYTAYKGKFTTASRKLELLIDLQSKNSQQLRPPILTNI